MNGSLIIHLLLISFLPFFLLVLCIASTGWKIKDFLFQEGSNKQADVFLIWEVKNKTSDFLGVSYIRQCFVNIAVLIQLCNLFDLGSLVNKVYLIK